MNSSEVSSARPRARALAVYYGAALSIIALSCIFLIVDVAEGSQNGTGMFVPLIGLIGGICLIALIGYIHLEMLSAIYEFTDSSAHARWGLLIRHDNSIQLGAVRSIKISQGPIQRLFRLGDVILYTTSSDVLVLWDLDHPAEKKDMLWEMVQSAAANRQSQHTGDR